ncbi:hypothetical protein IAI10_05670 [Clostridium sp. 19966]|uniref:dockerin type I domain-containing protein n=1 Tax=Clostridium sp. 19966 TaxID=2768166 RepID=UPI0028DED34C|nr:dockerin type I domain-containing protein [Clostridium sp. 19966]MDT8716136.1 hypothetical protein [Clostridium sp. 19966]
MYLKKVKSLSIFLLYFFILAAFPLPTVVNSIKVQAATNTSVDYTSNSSKLDLYTYDSAIYKDYAVIMTNDSVYLVKDGVNKKVGTRTLRDIFLGIAGDNAYFLSDNSTSQGEIYSVLTINLSTATQNSSQISSATDYSLFGNTIDNQGNVWLATGKYNEPNAPNDYYIMRINSSNSSDYEMYKTSSAEHSAAPTNLTADKNNNVWFDLDQNVVCKMTLNQGSLALNQYRIDKIMNKFMVDSKGNIWSADTDTASTLFKFSLQNGSYATVNKATFPEKYSWQSQFDIDQNDNIWYISTSSSPSKIYKFDGTNFVEKYIVSDAQVSSSKKYFNVINGTRMVSLKNKYDSSGNSYTVLTNINPSDAVLGDFNNDSIIDVKDLALQAQAYNSKTNSASYDERSDLNSDGIVDVYDITLEAKHLDK